MRHPLHVVDAKKKLKSDQIEVDDKKVARRIKDAVESMEERGLPPLSYPRRDSDSRIDAIGNGSSSSRAICKALG